MNSVGVAVGTELLDFKSSGGVTAVFASGVAVNAVGTFVGIGATFCAFHSDGNAYAFLTCHVGTFRLVVRIARVYTQISIFAYYPAALQQFL